MRTRLVTSTGAGVISYKSQQDEVLKGLLGTTPLVTSDPNYSFASFSSPADSGVKDLFVIFDQGTGVFPNIPLSEGTEIFVVFPAMGSVVLLFEDAA